MTNVIGQKKLIAKLSSYSFESMPSTLLLLGPTGSGKHFITTWLAKKLEVDLVELTPQTDAGTLIEYSQCPIPKVYYLDLTQITEKSQNKFLKFIEEPSPMARVILTAESEVGILPTVLNRCLKYTLEAYTIEELCQFAWAPKQANTLIYKFCNTPGLLLALGDVGKFEQTEKLCKDILELYPKLTGSDAYAKAMGVICHIACKETEVSKLDFWLFLDLFAYYAFEQYKQKKDKFSFGAYLYTIQQKQRLLNKAVNKEAFILSFLTEIWRLSKNDIS